MHLALLLEPKLCRERLGRRRAAELFPVKTDKRSQHMQEGGSSPPSSLTTSPKLSFFKMICVLFYLVLIGGTDAIFLQGVSR